MTTVKNTVFLWVITSKLFFSGGGGDWFLVMVNKNLVPGGGGGASLLGEEIFVGGEVGMRENPVGETLPVGKTLLLIINIAYNANYSTGVISCVSLL